MVAFAEALPRIRARVDADLARPGLPRERVLATVVRLLEDTLIRVGNDEYRRQNRSFGLTTLRDRHVDVHGTTIRFHFRGKHGIVHDVKVTDRRLARIVRRCRDIPGQELFQFVDDDGERHTIDSADVNAYLHEASGRGLHRQGLPHLGRHRPRGALLPHRRSRVERLADAAPGGAHHRAGGRSSSATRSPSAASATSTPRWWRPTSPAPSPPSKRREGRSEELAVQVPSAGSGRTKSQLAHRARAGPRRALG